MNTKGGTSPIKLRAGKAKSRRGGAEAGKATAKKGNYLGGRGGYKKSSGAQGTGVNRGGYNVHTRFKPRAKPEAPKGGGGTTKETTPQKPYSFDKDGDIVINNYIDGKGGTQTQSQTQGTEGYWTYKDLVTEHEYDNLESYQKVWDRNDKGVQDTYDNIDDFIKAAKEWWDSDEGKEEKKKREKGTYTTTERVKDKYITGTSGTQTQTQTQTQ
mgnify:CR=1 FL=1